MATKCKQWAGRINERGYGTIGPKLAHRVAWERVHGPIPAGLTLDHLCHDPNVCRLGNACPHRSCVNVAHMVLVDAKTNRERSYSARGIRTHCPAGHEYNEDNTLVSGGRRYCRACRTERLNNSRRIKSLQACDEQGHKREDVTGKDGRVYCSVCAKLRGKDSIAGRKRNKQGTFT